MKKIIGMFPGQGSQYVGMAKDWYEKYDSVKKRFDEASEIIGYDLAKLCFEGPNGSLTQTEHAQVAILTCSIAMYDVLKEEINFSYLMGHSLGEITALTAAGYIEFKDAVKLVKKRGEAMAACTKDVKTGMLAVTNIPEDTVHRIISNLNIKGKGVSIANYNSKNQIVLSGSFGDLTLVKDMLDEINDRSVFLNVTGAFHSPYMENASKELLEELETMEIHKGKIPVISCFDGNIYTNDMNIKNKISKHLVESVKWYHTLKKTEKKNIGIWIEIGPKEVLKKLVLRSIENENVFAVERDMEVISNALINLEEENNKEPNVLGLCLGAAVSTRNKNFNEEEYEEGVVKPYKILKEYYENNNTEVSTELFFKAIDQLKIIFNTKKVPIDEQEERIKYIFEETGNLNLFDKYPLI